MKRQPTLHTPLTIGPHRLKNRVVALPVFTGYAFADGSVSPLLLSHYSKLAASGAAMVVVANAAVSADGVTSKYNLRVDADRFVPGLEKLARAIHRQGALACIQLNHAGRYAKTARPLLASPVNAYNLAYNISALKDFINSFAIEQRFALTRFFLSQIGAWHQAATDQALHGVVTRFRQAARRAQQAGFDMIELHGANGYLLCEFFSPVANKRTSGFGGSLENRMALPLTVVSEIRRDLPTETPLGFRLLLEEWVPGGIQARESIVLAQALEKAGIRYFSVAAGTFNSIFRPHVAAKMAADAYLRQATAELKRQVTVPIIIAGRVITPLLADNLLADDTTDLIGLGRPLRADPDWIHKSREPAAKIKTCVNCNTCLKNVILEQGFICRRWPAVLKLATELKHLLLTRNYKGLWVICDRDDLQCFKAGLPDLLPASRWPAPRHGMTTLFMEGKTAAGCTAEEKAAFITWVQNQAVARGGCIDTPAARTIMVQDAWDRAVTNEAARGDYGMVLVARNENQPWRKRLLYLLRHKVVGLISPNPRLGRVAVPVDLSSPSLLVLNFLRQAYGNRPNVKIAFIHAIDGGSKESIERRWEKIKQAVGFHIDAPLKLIPSQGNAASAIVNEIAKSPYGTVIMGKRGLSGIKRILLGSVSRAVVKNTKDHTLFLVD